MTQRSTWKDLTVGIVALCAVTGLAAGILIFGRVGSLHGKTDQIYVTTDAARGVIRGTEVWLNGQKVGLVRDVQFRAPTVPRSERLLLVLQILDRVRPSIRHDTRVDIRSGGTLIGDQVVALSNGSARAPAVTNGDTIHAMQSDLESASDEVAEATKQFPAIIENVKLLDAQLHIAQGTVGAFEVDAAGKAAMKRVHAKSARIMARLSDSTGTLGLTFHDGTIHRRATELMTQVDSVRTLLTSDRSSVGRFRRDSTLTIEMNHMHTDLDQLKRLAMSPDGSLGRVRADTMLVRRVTISLDSLFAAMKAHPLRYGWAMRP